MADQVGRCDPGGRKGVEEGVWGGVLGFVWTLLRVSVSFDSYNLIAGSDCRRYLIWKEGQWQRRK